MRGQRSQRAYMAAAVLLIAASAATFVSVAPASAATKGKSVTCTSLSGNLNSTPPVTFTLGGCSGNTAGSGSAQGSTITWANGRTTFLALPAFTPSGNPRKGNCAALSDKWTVTDGVAGDSTGSIKAGGKVSAKVCILNESPDPWSLAPGSVLTIR